MHRHSTCSPRKKRKTDHSPEESGSKIATSILSASTELIPGTLPTPTICTSTVGGLICNPMYYRLPTSMLKNQARKRSSPLFHDLFLKAQTRLWGYDPEQLSRNEEFTQIKVDNSVDDRPVAKDNSPVEAQRMWERMAEDNAVDHLQKIGVLAPAGSVDKVLQTVVDNLIITNKLQIEPDVRCRVLLTLPLESFTIGHTIVISRISARRAPG